MPGAERVSRRLAPSEGRRGNLRSDEEGLIGLLTMSFTLEDFKKRSDMIYV